jgi:hypothetical protein
MARKAVYTDPSGDEVLAKFVQPYDKLRDQMAEVISKDWLEMEQRLAACKERTLDRIEKLRAAADKATGVSLGGKKGNLQFRSFDGSITVAIDRQCKTEFDERLAHAQELIHQALDDITAKAAHGASDASAVADLREIATKAFTPRRSGNLDMQRVRDLRSINVKHPLWRQACEIIADCERTIGHRDYLRVAVREHADKSPRGINLDIARV